MQITSRDDPDPRKNMSRGAPYFYAPLPSATSFRVLELFPGDGSEEISYHMRFVDWMDPPDYEAISYCWGDPSVTVATMCDGFSIHVTQNLQDALRHLRRRHTSRVLWADAICIDQRGNPDDRARQVNNMREIYSRAKRVIVWLGLDKDDCAATAARAVQDIAAYCCACNSISIPDLRHVTKFNQIAENSPHWQQLPCNSIEVWQALVWLFSFPWFSRLWVLQEVSAIPDVVVICGTVELVWDMVGLTAEYLTSQRDLFDEMRFCQTKIWGAVSLRDRSLHSGTMLDLLSIARTLHVTKAEDTVYGLLGMPAFTSGKFPLRADYSKSLSQIYREVVEVSLRSLQSVEILASVQHAPKIESDMPSWVPRWNREKICHVILYSIRHIKKGNASGDLEFSYSIDHDSQVLEIPGLRFDVVESRTKIDNEQWFNSRRNVMENHPVLEFWLKENRSPTQYPTGEPALDAYSSIFTLGPGGGLPINVRSTNPSHENFAAYVQQLMELSGHPPVHYLGLQEEAKTGNWYAWEDMARDGCWGRSFFRTKGGYMGLGPQILQPGDFVCVLAGGEVPFILRPDHDYYKLVGECYLHGIMNGEAVRKQDHIGRFKIK